MRRLGPLLRTFAVAGLLFGVLASTLTLGAAQVAAQDESVKLVLHVLTCPKGTEGDIFEACHDNRVNKPKFTIADAAEPVTGDKEGVIEVTVEADQIVNGKVKVEEVNFKSIATDGRATMYCSPQPAGEPLTEYKTSDGSIRVAVEPGTEVLCDWYNWVDPNAPTATPGGGDEPTATPGGGDEPTPTATATTPTGGESYVWIHAIECPANAEGDIFEACHDNRLEDVVYDIGGTFAVSDSDGVAAVDGVPSGDLVIEELDFENLATAGRAYVFCSVQPGGDPVLFEGSTRNGLVTFDIPDWATEVHCDWYNRTSDFGPTPTGEATNTPEPTTTPYPTNTPEPTQSGGGGGGGNATATATTQTTLPTTGTGPNNTSTSSTGLAFGVILALIAISAAAFSMRRRNAGAASK